jgi:cytochrome P450
LYFILFIIFSIAGEPKEKDEFKLKQRLSYWLGNYWVEFDNVYMKPRLIHNWPAVKNEHDQVSKIIKDVIKDFKDEKNENSKDNLRKHLENDILSHKKDSQDYTRLSRDQAMYDEPNYSDTKIKNRLFTSESLK